VARTKPNCPRVPERVTATSCVLSGPHNRLMAGGAIMTDTTLLLVVDTSHPETRGTLSADTLRLLDTNQ
jgi:hypothetical protein